MSQERNKFFFEEKRANAEEEIVDEYDEDVNVSFEFCKSCRKYQDFNEERNKKDTKQVDNDSNGFKDHSSWK